MFVRVVLVLLAAALAWAILARDTGAVGRPGVYTVRPGDTLWGIAVRRYGGDPRKGVWLLERRNGLRRPTIVPGQRLLLP